MITYVEDVYRLCTGCNEEWPDDEEFYHPGHKRCIACEYEARAANPSRSTDARKEEWKRYRAKKSGA